MAKINMIVAVSDNCVIGNDGKIPWHHPQDLKFFKNKTIGNVVIMGRNTHESIARLLPERENFVLSRDPEYKGFEAKVFDSLEGAVHVASTEFPDKEIWIIGGAHVYKAALDYGFVNELYITRVKGDHPGDTFFPSKPELEQIGFQFVPIHNVFYSDEIELELWVNKAKIITEPWDVKIQSNGSTLTRDQHIAQVAEAIVFSKYPEFAYKRFQSEQGAADFAKAIDNFKLDAQIYVDLTIRHINEFGRKLGNPEAAIQYLRESGLL